MKYYIIAGEASGDMHAANLMKAIKERDPAAQFRAWGGDLMQAQGAHLVKHYRDLAFMGFVEVLLNLRTILRNIAFCKKDITQWQPDVLILVDYPGFNLRIARFAHDAGIKVAYYISPQVWAWKKGRVKTIKKTVDKMLVILPFEEDFYAKHGMKVDFVGHPLLDALQNEKHDSFERFCNTHGLTGKPLAALLPGSRKQEVAKMLQVMLEMVGHFPDHEFVVAGVEALGRSFYDKITDKYQGVKVLFGQTHEILFHASAALVTSGTATLETALIGTPEVVCYKGSTLSYEIAKRVIKVKYISLVNLIMDKPVVTELIQHELTPDNLFAELNRLLYEESRINRLKEDYALLRQKLGNKGASRKAAAKILELIDL